MHSCRDFIERTTNTCMSDRTSNGRNFAPGIRAMSQHPDSRSIAGVFLKMARRTAVEHEEVFGTGLQCHARTAASVHVALVQPKSQTLKPDAKMQPKPAQPASTYLLDSQQPQTNAASIGFSQRPDVPKNETATRPHQKPITPVYRCSKIPNVGAQEAFIAPIPSPERSCQREVL